MSSQTVRPTVTMYYADWCGNCTRMKPLFEEAAGRPFLDLAGDEQSQFKTVSDVQMQNGKAPDITITGFPTFVFRQDGRIVHVIVGADARDFKVQVRKFFNVDIGGGAVPPRPIRKIGGAPEVDHDAFRNIMLR